MTGAGSKQKRKITTSDLARLSGVSRSTVSAVLNGKRSVREATRAKVLACIREQRYDSGLIARTLLGELSRIVAVLAPNLGSPYHMMYFQGLQDILGKEDFHLLFHNVRPEDQEDPATLESIHAYRPAGFIILRGAEGPQAEHARKVVEEGVPLVCEMPIDGLETHVVGFDQRAAMKLAADYVIEKGHRRLGHIAGPSFSHGARERKIGFLESLVQHDMPLSEANILDAGETAADGYVAALEMLRDPATRPTAVLCFNDMVAMGVYRACHELKMNIPADVSVVGYDGIEFAALFGPPLTSVNIFPTEMGRRAGEVLVRAIRNEAGRGATTTWIPSELTERGSVRAL